MKHIKLHYSEHVQGACQKNLTIYSVPGCVKCAQYREINVNNNLVEELDALPNLNHFENLTESESQPSLLPLSRRAIYPGDGILLSNYPAEP